MQARRRGLRTGLRYLTLDATPHLRAARARNEQTDSLREAERTVTQTLQASLDRLSTSTSAK